MNTFYSYVIDYYYPSPSPLKELLLAHSEAVKNRALDIAQAHPEMKLDHNLIVNGAMLHDIGILRCDAPRIHCHGTEPYICHGKIGAEMVRAFVEQLIANHQHMCICPECDSRVVGNGVHIDNFTEQLARICERHTSAGITVDDIRTQHLPLSLRDYQPETLEEKVICYADKFFSKTKPNLTKTFEEACRSLEKFGTEGVQRFMAWKKLFE